MPYVHHISLVVIGVTWLFAWRVGLRWSRSCGVNERVSLIVLACVLPTAGLVASVHLVALLSLLCHQGWVTPESVGVVFLALTGLAHRQVKTAASCVPQDGGSVRGLWRLVQRGHLWIPAGILCAVYLVFLVDAVTRFPTGYDAQAYHLPLAVTWMQQQSLVFQIGEVHEAFPENGMIVPFLLAFARLETLFCVVHLPKGLLAAAAVYGLVRVAEHKRRTAFIGACIVLSIPIVLFQSFSGYVDLYAAASWLSSLLALGWASRAGQARQRRGLLVIAGLSAGVALGSKTTYLVLVGLLLVVAMLVDWIRLRMGPSARLQPLRNALVFGLCTLACSGFWFVRGTVQAGNPIFPLGVKIGDYEILPGYYANEYFGEGSYYGHIKMWHRWWNYPWKETKHYGTGYPYGVNNALGAAYAAFVPVGVFATLIHLPFRRRRGSADRLRMVCLVLALSGAALLFTLFNEMLRFVLPLVLLSVVAASGMLDGIGARGRRCVVPVLSVALLVTAAVATLKPVHSFVGRVKDGVWARSSFYQVPTVLDDLPPGTRILNLGSMSSVYALMGRHLTNHVISPWQWEVLYKGEPLSACAIRSHGIAYLYLEAPWPTDWPTDLPVELVFDSMRDAQPRGTPARMFRVKPTDSPSPTPVRVSVRSRF
ncbi:MAG: hypothetical protein WBE26_00630 [Phycisphaerae bacterium]